MVTQGSESCIRRLCGLGLQRACGLGSRETVEIGPSIYKDYKQDYGATIGTEEHELETGCMSGCIRVSAGACSIRMLQP